MAFFILLVFIILSTIPNSPASATTTCRSSCGSLRIRFPLAVDDGCGSPSYRHLLSCLDLPSSSPLLLLRTPSGSYPVHSLSYSGDPHLIISDPSMWTCSHSPPLPSSPFSLDTSTRFSLSSRNTFLFLNCSADAVLVQPRSPFCDRYPGRCGSSCDSAAYLCRNLPGCPNALAERATTCCSYFPTAAESVRMMLRHCAAYAGVYWRSTGGGTTVDDDEPPEQGIRLDFEIPATGRCRSCAEKGEGTCGFDTATGSFLCLCRGGNSTTTCEDGSWRNRASTGVIAVPASLASLAAVAGMGALIYYLRKMKNSNKVVTCGVESTDNRTF